MIPKIIHYCWFGRGKMPELARKCIMSWKKYLPDYEIKEWNEDNFDVNIIPYTAEAYKARKYAFVSDYARFWILYKYGGLYYDTDVEVIKPMDFIIDRGPFMGCQNDIKREMTALEVAPGLGLGATPGLDLYKELLDFYSNIHFIKEDGSYNQVTIVKYTTDLLVNHGLKNKNEIQLVANINIYPKDYFCPIDFRTGKKTITSHTVAIHHFSGSWVPLEQRIEKKLWKGLGVKPHRFMWHFDNLLTKIFNIIR